MENIYFEQFGYVQISILKNYSRLIDRPGQPSNPNPLRASWIFAEPFHEMTLFNYNDKKSYFGIPKNKMGNVNSVYFHSHGEKTFNVPFEEVINPFYDKKYGSRSTVFTTTKDHTIKRHYDNPFSTIQVNKIIRKIFKNGDKLTINVFNGINRRPYNKRFFRSSYHSHSITINLKTGNFVITTISKTEKSNLRNKKFLTNDFHSLMRTLEVMFKEYDPATHNQRKDVDFFMEIYKIFGNEFDFKPINGSKINRESLLMLYFKLVDFFIKTKKIGVPNSDYAHWLKEYYPTEKYLKKNKRKLVSSILDMLGIKSKTTIKILHRTPIKNVVLLKCTYDIFGEDANHWVSKIDWETYYQNECRQLSSTPDKLVDYHIMSGKNFYKNHYDHMVNVRIGDLSLFEKNYIVNIINSWVTHIKTIKDFTRLLTIFNDIADHFKMYRKIKDHFTDVELSAKTVTGFYEEHRHFSLLNNILKKKTETILTFDENTIKTIETDIVIDGGVVIKPVLLKSGLEYTSEGTYMHHCVSSYINKEESIIVSLRDENGLRVTCEVNIKTGDIIQARHYCNQAPPEIFETPIEALKKRTKRLSKTNMLGPQNRKTVILSTKDLLS
jgi:hypothetical protein